MIPRTQLVAISAAGLLAVAAGPVAALSSAPVHHHDPTPRGTAPPGAATSEAARGGDGPHVVNADAFTTDHRGLKPGQIEMTTVDARPTLITGHEAKLAIRGLSKHDRLRVHVGDRRVRRHVFHHVASRPGQAKGAVEGVVRHLHLGINTVTAVATDKRYGARRVRLRLLVHSLQGPVITGPHQEPFICNTIEAGLPQAKNKNCTVKTEIHWWYRDRQGNFHRLAHPRAAYPKDVDTTTIHGKTVPFVARVENVVINRAVTRLAVLDDPHARGHKPFRPTEWDHNLAWHFGESCGTGYHQGSDGGETSVFSPLSSVGGENVAGPFLNLPGLLGNGYMVGESSLTIFGVHCNQVLSAETLMMAKEYITDHYGDVNHVVGGGASGGAIQQYTIANGYPGILDAGTPLLSFPDVVSTAMTVGDCVVLKHFFDTHSGNGWGSTQQDAVTGLANPQVCADWVADFAGNLKPTSCPGQVPVATIYNPQTNPNGVRCDLQDDLKNILGTNPKTHQGLRPLDNVGVQYGLDALRRGRINPAQFVSLNLQVGGVDLDGNYVGRRESMSQHEAQRIWRDSLVGEFGAINQTPIIDQTIPVSDDIPQLDIHDEIRPYEIRARLDARYGSHRSQAIWSGTPLPSSAMTTANTWLNDLDALQAKHPWKPRSWLVAHSRPSAAGDQCRTGLTGPPVECSVGKHSGPRQMAGGPVAEDVLKCRLRPLRRSDYPSTMTTAEFTTLQQVFPHGVCDYSKHSVGYTKHSRTWLSYGDTTLYRHPVVVPYPLVRSRVPH